jgi:LmbE family N-acetylglucosaminyl deacetylase
MMPTVAAVIAGWNQAPLVAFDQLAGDRPLLVLAPHPDDESLGCGGLIAEACARGHPVHVAVLTDGARSHRSPSYPPPRLAALRAEEVRRAVAVLGVPARRLHLMGLPDGAAPQEGDAFVSVVDELARLMEQADIGTVFATWGGDPHGDHVAAHLISAAAARRTGAHHFSYPIWGWTLPPDQALANSPAALRLDIARHQPAKRRAVAAHASQFGGLITDDPAGFKLPRSFLQLFDRPYEVFLRPAALPACVGA